VTSQNNITATTLDDQCGSTNAIASKQANNKTTPKHDVITLSVLLYASASMSLARKTSESSTSKGNRNSFQLMLYEGPNPSADSKLTIAIADMIHSLGLTFSLTSEPKVCIVLTGACTVGRNYQVPTSWNQIANKVFDCKFDQYKQEKAHGVISQGF
jgi:hypothetical protein